MTRLTTLRLLLVAEPSGDLRSVEATIVAINARLDELNPEGSDYAHAHRRLNELLAHRARLVESAGGRG